MYNDRTGGTILTEAQSAIRDAVHDFVPERIRPHSAPYEAAKMYRLTGGGQARHWTCAIRFDDMFVPEELRIGEAAVVATERN